MTNHSLELDSDHLAEYLSEHIDGFSGPMSASKFAGGQSNPTYLLETPTQKYVLRRQPPGKLLKGAHAVDREFQVMSALSSSAVPVAQAVHLCTDAKVIGSQFYIMEYKDGRVLWDPALPDQSIQERGQIYDQMNRTLAALHQVNVDQVGLSDYGKKTDYFARQVHTWSKNYRAAEIDTVAAMDFLIEWLPANLPPADGKFSIVHGDYRLDNLMFDKKDNRVIAVLDWELSTIGHPYADLAYQCMLYYIPGGEGLPGLAGADIDALGIPTEQQYIQQYCERTGNSSIPHWNFYLAFSLFRLASICQGVVKRAQQGNASNESAGEYGNLVGLFANTAKNISTQ